MPQCRTDFIALKDGVAEKIQVKKATLNVCDSNTYLQIRLSSRLGTRYTKEDVDYFFIVWNKLRWIIPFEDLEGKTSCTICKVLEDGSLVDNKGKRSIKISKYLVNTTTH